MEREANMNTRGLVRSELYCSVCGCKGIPVIRDHGQQRGKNHMKKMYCINCKKETNHVEKRYKDYDRL